MGKASQSTVDVFIYTQGLKLDRISACASARRIASEEKEPRLAKTRVASGWPHRACVETCEMICAVLSSTARAHWTRRPLWCARLHAVWSLSTRVVSPPCTHRYTPRGCAARAGRGPETRSPLESRLRRAALRRHPRRATGCPGRRPAAWSARGRARCKSGHRRACACGP